MTVALLLVHGDDSLGLDEALREFATAADAAERTEIVTYLKQRMNVN